MFRDDRDFYPGSRRPGLWSYLAVALLGAIIGGLIVAYLSPLLVKEKARPDQAGLKPPQSSVVSVYDSPVIQIAEKVGPAVVGISNRVNVSTFFSQQRVEKGSGSGVIFDSGGYIVTNYHVINGADQLMVTLADGRQLPGKVVGADRRTDLAVLKVDKKGLPAAAFGDSDKIRVGELAVAIGNPLGEELFSTVTAGVISAVNRSVEVQAERFRLIQTDAAINPGNSGGALVNSRGEVIGINSIKIVDVNIEGLNFAIPSNTVKPIVASIIEHGRVIRPWLGIVFGGDVNPAIAEQYGLGTDRGVLVAELPAGSPAAKAGVKSGDVIVSFNKQEIKNFAELRVSVDKQKIGDKVEIIIVRGKSRQTLTLTLEQLPE